MAETTIERIALDPTKGDGGVLCQLTDGRVFVTLSAEIAKFAEPGDESALPAFQRAWVREPDLFAGPITPRMPKVDGSSLPRIAPEPEGEMVAEAGFIGELTPRDRARLERIIEKNHKFYFADHPTKAQVDNLINGIGLRVAEQMVRKALDGGMIN